MALTFFKSIPANIKVLSFDLDDTLYQNEQVIQDAEQAQFAMICSLVPEATHLGSQPWIDLKWQIAKQNPDLCHDVTQWRQAVIVQGLINIGLTQNKAEALLPKIFDAFYDARSNFTVPEETFSVLKQLQQKWTLVAVTNGNADIHRLGLAPYFQRYYRAGEQQTRMKPHPDMLLLAAKDLNVLPEEILHIGDNIGSDIHAAHNAGCPSLWFNPEEKKFSSYTALPTAEYKNINDLLALL